MHVPARIHSTLLYCVNIWKCTVTDSTSITEEVISFSLADHCAQYINFGDWMQVVEVNT